jgi:ATP/maltotriose-dependent transcriptional regulator MalT
MIYNDDEAQPARGARRTLADARLGLRRFPAIMAASHVGLSNGEIAERLVVAVGTVKRHINNIFSKLNVTSRTQALARGRELGLL